MDPLPGSGRLEPNATFDKKNRRKPQKNAKYRGKIVFLSLKCRRSVTESTYSWRKLSAKVAGLIILGG
jgi:hypothetical protein